MKSIAFYNNKGGVGKTTSVINIAYELSGENSVLVIDVDGQANCSRFFTEELKEGLDKALVNTEVSPETALCHTRYDNIDIITATPKLNGITSEFDSFTDEEQAAIARNILSFGSAYDYVLLDLPPALTKVTERLIGACDVVFIPIELGIFSIQGVPTVTGIVKKCGAKFGGCIINKYDKKNSADAQLLELLNETLGNKTLKSKIPYSKISPEELSEEFVDETQISLEDSVLGKIARNELLDFINTLPKLQKDVLTLYSTFGFSFSEIAEELGISETATRQRLFLARKAVRQFAESRLNYE